jgi:hypothetical protein
MSYTANSAPATEASRPMPVVGNSNIIVPIETSPANNLLFT